MCSIRRIRQICRPLPISPALASAYHHHHQPGLRRASTVAQTRGCDEYNDVFPPLSKLSVGQTRHRQPHAVKDSILPADQPFEAFGFFPPAEKQASEEEDDGITLRKSVARLLDDRPRDLASMGIATSTRVPRLVHKKVDLSYVNPATFQPLKNRSSDLVQGQYVTFRTSGVMRWLTAAYIDHGMLVEDSQNLTSESAWWATDEPVALIFSPDRLAELQEFGYEKEDVMNWASILNAPNVNLAISRYIEINQQLLADGKQDSPLWVVLQLLRAPRITATSLSQLIQYLLTTTARHSAVPVPGRSLDRLSYREARKHGLWDAKSATILAVRLLRHARRVLPPACQDIATLTSRTLLLLHEHGPTSYEDLSFSCNRIMSLTASPANVQPYYSVVYQQSAQMTLLRAMSHMKPQIPLSREGYRALVRVQLAHDKLDMEKVWSKTQSLSWPPWPKANLGIEENIDHPGKESRTLKVLRRMLEAGYAHGPWEKIAAVIAGRDTDKSPTIQTRHMIRAPRTRPDAAENDPSLQAQLWAARITATRTIREAWACFISYSKADDATPKRVEPYHAMFAKLMAREQNVDDQSQSLHGDGKEVFADPQSPRDLVYIESPPPSIDTFYQRMLNDGVKPVGRLLTDLINQAKTLEEGVKYLRDSRYDEVKKDMLFMAHKYSADQIRRTLQSLPDNFVATFLQMLVRRCEDSVPRGMSTKLPSWYVIPKGPRRLEKPILSYAIMLLTTSETSYLPAWNAILKGLHCFPTTWARSRTRSMKLANTVDSVVDSMLAHSIDIDFTTFQLSTSLTMNCLSASPDLSSPAWRKASLRPQTLFAQALYEAPLGWITEAGSKPVLSWPEPEALCLLIETLGVGPGHRPLIDLANWMAQHADGIKNAEKHRKNAQQLRRVNLIMLRVFLEAWWIDDPEQRERCCVEEEQLKEIRSRLKETLGWPEDEEMVDFLEQWKVWLGRVRRMIEVGIDRERRTPMAATESQDEDARSIDNSDEH